MALLLPSLKRNIAANTMAQFYVMGIGLIMAPVYLSFLGTEAYGLIGFFSMLTVLFQLLDAGLTPTLVRQTARFRGGAVNAQELRVLLRSLELVFGVASVAGALAIALFADYIARHWLKVATLPIHQVAHAIMLMGFAVPLRWMAGLHRGVISGFERQIWLGGYNTAIATARFVGVLPVLVIFGATPVNFFVYQLVIAFVEWSGLIVMTYMLIKPAAAQQPEFSWTPLKGNLTFSMAIAFTATAWVLVTQMDKLILSNRLRLAEYGVFSIAVMAASAINMANGPFNQALLPRLTKLVAQKDEQGVIRLYGATTQAVCVLVAPAVAILCFFGQPLLFGWTGNAGIAQSAAPILALYAIGNGCACLHSFLYCIQYAKGDLVLHFIGHALLLALLLPLFWVGAAHYGAVGTGAGWALANACYLLGWAPVVLARLFKNRSWHWLRQDAFPIVVPTLFAAWLLKTVIHVPAGRWAALGAVVGLGIALLAVACAGSSLVRERIMQFHKFRRATS